MAIVVNLNNKHILDCPKTETKPFVLSICQKKASRSLTLIYHVNNLSAL